MKKYIFLLIVGLIATSWSACRPDPSVVELTEFYFTANIAGDSITIIDQGDVPGGLGFYANKDSIPVDGTNCVVTYQSQFRDISSVSQQSLFFTFNRYYEGICANEPTDFRTLFQPELQLPADNEDSRGWLLLYRDETGKNWYSLWGNQSESIFEITSSEEIADDVSFNFKRQKVTGRISCKLYDDNGASVEVENARFSIYVASYDW